RAFNLDLLICLFSEQPNNHATHVPQKRRKKQKDLSMLSHKMDFNYASETCRKARGYIYKRKCSFSKHSKTSWKFRYLLRNNVSPDLCNEDGLTALHQCCIDNYEEMVKLLLDRGASVNAQDNELWTPLHAAATCGHAGLVKILIFGGYMLSYQKAPVAYYKVCIEEFHLSVGLPQTIILIVDYTGGKQSLFPSLLLQLHIAAANGYAQAAELLLEGGARVDLRDSDGWQPLHAAACWGQMHVAELLVSHGASLNAKTFLEETPIDLCEDEEFRAILLDLKHKHDIIMKSQLKHKTSLCRRTSSAGSRGKVVRRASLSDRHNLCRKEYETEAIVWRKEKEDEDEKEKESDQENSQVVNVKPVVAVELPDKSNLPTILKEGNSKQNGLISTTTSMPPPPPSNGSTPTSSKERPQTLSELKKQRAAAKLLNHPLFNGHLGNGSTDSFTDAKTTSEDPRMPLVSSNGNAVYYTPASGDPPLLKFKQPMEEEQPKVRTCCCVS
uniref:Protein phosphatase 1, regulatory subunit 16B n=1 Tax=Neolamprologus brichardi TaxID=32507 RepID=A0A3Q4GH46_NEOBR